MWLLTQRYRRYHWQIATDEIRCPPPQDSYHSWNKAAKENHNMQQMMQECPGTCWRSNYWWPLCYTTVKKENHNMQQMMQEYPGTCWRSNRWQHQCAHTVQVNWSVLSKNNKCLKINCFKLTLPSSSSKPPLSFGNTHCAREMPLKSISTSKV